MCITLHASEMSGTRLYAGEATRSGTYVHVMMEFIYGREGLCHKCWKIVKDKR